MIIGDTITREEQVDFTAEFMVKDIQKSIDFYTKVLGFRLHRVTPDGKFAIIFLEKAMVMLYEVTTLSEPRFSGLEVRFLINDIDSYYKKIIARGAEFEKTIFNAPYGLRQFYVKNPDGVSLKFSSVINRE